MKQTTANKTEKSDSRVSSPALRREVGVWGAVFMGLGSIVGTGVFVSIAIAVNVTGPAVILAIALAALVAIFNGLSSAQLAAAHPVSGGTYEYGYQFLNPTLGFTAGWMFLCAKSASAATAALGFAGALIQLLAWDPSWAKPTLALTMILVLTGLVLLGIRRSNQVNTVIVLLTLIALAAFVLTGLPTALQNTTTNCLPFFAPQVEGSSPAVGFLSATALMFVAFTGYGRIATMAEEVREPRRTIPRAVIATLVVSAILYIAVGFVGVAAVGPAVFAESGVRQAAPLQMVAQQIGYPPIAVVVSIGALTAMLGVSLNLILGLSRVALAMGRRGDLPRGLATINPRTSSPDAATWLVAIMIIGLALIGDVKTTWSFSAFTVLIYYAITNLAATRLLPEQRMFPKFIAWLGLISCLLLAFWVERQIWLTGMGLIGLGVIWHFMMHRSDRRKR